MSDISTDITGSVEVEQDITTPEELDNSIESTDDDGAINSIDDALAKALAHHTPSDDKTTATVKQAPAALAAQPELKPGQVFDPVSNRVLDPITAPGGLTPTLREKWSTVPREFQQYWSERERHMSQQLQETAEARRGWNEFRQVSQPYEALLRQNNTTATQHAQQLFNLSYQLQTGTPQRKAEIFVHMLKEFQPDAQTLQALLAGQQVAPQTTTQPPVNVAKEIERFEAERAAKLQQQSAESAAQAFANDPANEFFSDVRDMMGKAIDAGLVDGANEAELLKNAYEFSCRNHPDVSKVLAGRTTAATPTAKPAPVARPNGQVKPTLGAPRAAAKKHAAPKSIDEALEMALRDHGEQ